MAGLVTWSFASGSAMAVDLPSYATPDPAPAGSLPAVSGPNFKVDGFGGYSETDTVDGGIAGVSGSFTVPLGERFGAQLDGMAASLDGDLPPIPRPSDPVPGQDKVPESICPESVILSNA
jgi:hypothetical protein